MKNYYSGQFIIFSSIIFTLLLIFNLLWLQGRNMNYQKINNLKQLVSLFPKNPNTIKSTIEEALKVSKNEMDRILKLNPKDYSYENTIRMYDKISSLYSLAHSSISVIKLTHSDESMRKAAEECLSKADKEALDIFQNKDIYNVFINYEKNNKNKENLTKAEAYFLDETLKDFKRAGLALDDKKFEEAQKIKKELSLLSLKFHTNIYSDQPKVIVSHEELKGLSDDFIRKLERSSDKYVLGCDYPTYFEVIENCSVSSTREKIWLAFNNLGYPVNEEILSEMIKLRDKLAKILGFENYASLDIDSQMAKKPKVAEDFILGLISKAQSKMTLEFENFIKKLPEGVELVDNKLKPWDYSYLKNSFKKQNFSVDERLIAEYFPMEKTINALFNIYQSFLNLEFKIEKTNDFWQEDLSLISVYSKGKEKFLGYIVLDLFPRPNKYSHACMYPIVGPILYKDKNSNEKFERSAVAVVIANFTKPSSDKPSLLKHDEVKTFFHEFGHAMHQLLGQTEIASFSGTSTKTDFVEMPSQMFEEWIWDKDILKSLSSHYLTGASLPDDIINNKIALKKLDSGFFLTRQAILSLLSLNLFLDGEYKNIFEVNKALTSKYIPQMLWDDRNHFYTSFGHLVSYDSKYYSYMWSKVFAIDLFDKVKKNGLLNPKVGGELAEKVLGEGGEIDPEELLISFLGRKPNSEAFFAELGIV